ncbi:hypothetical protein ACFQ6A_40210, partial [Streptomyces niveus]
SPIPPRVAKYERAHEVVQIVQALWGSWEKDAWLRDVDAPRTASTHDTRRTARPRPPEPVRPYDTPGALIPHD